MIDAIDEVLSRPLCQPPPPSRTVRAAEAAERRRLLEIERRLEIEAAELQAHPPE